MALVLQSTTITQLPELLELLYAHLPMPDREQRVAAMLSNYQYDQQPVTKDNVPLDGIFHCSRSDEIVAGVLTMLRPDGTLLSLMPVATLGEPRETVQLTYHRLIKYAHEKQACIVMLLVDYQQMPDDALLDEFGFQKVSELYNFNAERITFPQQWIPQNRSLQMLPYQNDHWDEMMAIVEKTYQKTLDFPMLTGIVPTASILKGYQESHPFDPSLWFFIQYEKTIIGTLLLTQLETSEHLELTYVGFTPVFRGKKLAGDIVRFAQWIAWERGCSHLLVSADAANFPALKTYLNAGFHLYDCKKIFVRFLR